MNIPVQVEPSRSALPAVEYRWDTDTEILTASVQANGTGEGLSGTLELQGRDGSWLNLDLHSGRLRGIEVAVWPDVQTRSALAPPATVEDAAIMVAPRSPHSGIAAVEVNAAITAETDARESTFHFRVGATRRGRIIRVAADILLELDVKSQISGVWLLNVPPFPQVQ